MKNIIHQKLNLPRHVAVMVLPQATLFPMAMLPLYIFEPRYRAMLAWTLEQNRMFCVAPMKRGVFEAFSDEDFHHTVGLGLVRACRSHEDGTSHLVLQGIARVKLARFIQDEETPFRIAEIRELASTAMPVDEVEGRIARLHKVCTNVQPSGALMEAGLDEQLAKIHDPEVLTDVVAHTFLRDPEHRREVFEELHVGRRMQMLIEHLEAESQSAE